MREGVGINYLWMGGGPGKSYIDPTVILKQIQKRVWHERFNGSFDMGKEMMGVLTSWARRKASRGEGLNGSLPGLSNLYDIISDNRASRCPTQLSPPPASCFFPTIVFCFHLKYSFSNTNTKLRLRWDPPVSGLFLLLDCFFFSF